MAKFDREKWLKQKKVVAARYKEQKKVEDSGKITIKKKGLFPTGTKEWIPEVRDEKHQFDIIMMPTGEYKPKPMAEGSPYYKIESVRDYENIDFWYCTKYVVHPNVGTDGHGQMICLKQTYGRSCPACDDLLEWYTEDKGKQKSEKIHLDKCNAIKWKPKFSCNVLVKGEEDKGCQIYTIPESYSKDIDAKAKDTDQQNFKESLLPDMDRLLYYDADENGRTVAFQQMPRDQDQKAKLENIALRVRDYNVFDYIDKAYNIEDLLVKGDLFVWKNKKIDWAATEQKHKNFYFGLEDDEESEIEKDAKEVEQPKKELKKENKKEEIEEKKEEVTEQKDNDMTDERQWEELKNMELPEKKPQLIELIQNYPVLSDIDTELSEDDLWNAVDDIIEKHS